MGQVLPNVLGELGLDAAAAALRVSECWDEVVGPEIASHCQPVGMRAGVLEAAADSSVWCQHVQLRSPEILAGLKEQMGEDAPASLRLHISA
jgi:predicted nucleic acid-binding Zn ribbon protein